MKITPLATGTGTPAGANLSPERMPQDKIARAKAIASGKDPGLNISPSDRNGDQAAFEAAQRSIRKLKLRTQMSPDRPYEQTLQQNQSNPDQTVQDAAPGAAENAISDVNEPTPVVSEETKPLSPQFAALARQKRALQVKERELAEREAKLTGPNMDEYVSKADLQANPLKVFEAGVTYDKLTEALLSNPSGMSPEIQSLKDEIKALKEGVDKNLSDRDLQSEQQVLSEMKREADRMVSQGDEYELIRGKGYAPKAIDLIHKTWKATGEIMDVQEALSLVENQLLEDAIKDAQYKKVQGRLTPAQSDQLQSQQSHPNRTMRTLTNRDGATDSRDRRSRAIAAFYGQRK